MWDIEEDGDPVTSRLRIIVTGLVAQYPVGGVAWDYLQYVIGLRPPRSRRLLPRGHLVLALSPGPTDADRTTCKYSAAYLKAFFEQYSPELREPMALPAPARDELRHVDAQILIEVGAGRQISLSTSAGRAACSRKILSATLRRRSSWIPTPGYNQIVLSERPSWSENVDRWCANVFAHDHHFTYAENIDSPDCLVPGVGLRWQKTHMPVVGDLWKKVADTKPTPDAPWSTVMTWNVFKGVLEYRGKEYHGKAVEFEKIIDLPKRLSRPFRLSVGGTKAPFARLSAHGWAVEDGPATTLTPRDYQNFIAASHGEISVAKNVYVGLQNRLVQLSFGVLPRRRETGRRPGHGVFALHFPRSGNAVLQHRRRGN